MELKVLTRTVFGKKTKLLRAKGLIPAELYGHEIENLHISVAKKDLIKLQKTGEAHSVITLLTEDAKKIPVLIANIAKDSMSDEILALDFHQIKMDEKIRTTIPIEFIGEAPASKVGLVLVKVLDEIEIEALPSHIPSHIEVDISKLENAGDTIHVADLHVKKEVKIHLPEDTVIITIGEKRKEEVVTPPPTPEGTAETPVTTGEVTPQEESEKK
jgi:large subunit ribosomal protein L25